MGAVMKHVGSGAALLLGLTALACDSGDAGNTGGASGAGGFAGSSSGGSAGATGGGAGAGAMGGYGGTAGLGATGGAGGKPECVAGTVSTCYGGPPGSDGLGTCTTGVRTCDASGKFGPCAGEVLPSAPDCTTAGQDESCSGTADPCLGAPLLAALYGDAAMQAGSTVAAKPNGNIVVSGVSKGSIDFGAGPLGPKGMFLVELGPTGSVVWQKLFPGGWARSLKTDASGNVFLYGMFGGTLDLGGGPLVSGSGTELFLAKFDSSGQHVFSKHLPVDADDNYDWGAATTPSGGVVITGRLEGSADLGGGPLLGAGSADVFVAAFDGTGKHEWSKRFGSAGNERGTGVAVDPAGNLIVVGYFGGSFDFGGAPLTAAGADSFVAKLSSTGGHLWSKSFGGPGNQFAMDVGVDAAGAIAIAGMSNGTADLGGGPKQVTPADAVGFAGKLDASGSHLWSMAFGCTANPYVPTGPRLAVAPSGTVYVTGSTGLVNAFAFAIEASGARRWSRIFSTKEAEGFGVAVDASSHVWLTGTVGSPVDFGTGLKTPAGDDLYLVRVSP